MAHDPARRLRQLQRVLAIIELIGPLRFGATVNEIGHELPDITGQAYHPRTVERDFLALEEIGLVERVKIGDRWREDRWRLLRQNARAERLFQLAETTNNAELVPS